MDRFQKLDHKRAILDILLSNTTIERRKSRLERTSAQAPQPRIERSLALMRSKGRLNRIYDRVHTSSDRVYFQAPKKSVRLALLWK